MPEYSPSVAFTLGKRARFDHGRGCSILKRTAWFSDAVTVTGGEPTLYQELPAALAVFKELGYLVKLDTNGTNPAMLQQLIERQPDYVAMDIKGLGLPQILAPCGKLTTEEFFNVRSSIRLLMEAPIKRVSYHRGSGFASTRRNRRNRPLYQGASLYPAAVNPSATLDTDLEP